MVAAGEVSANITLKVVGCNLVVNRSVALGITAALLLAVITEEAATAGVEVTIVKDHQLERYSNDIVRWKIPTFWKSWPQLVYIQFLNLLSWV